MISSIHRVSGFTAVTNFNEFNELVLRHQGKSVGNIISDQGSDYTSIQFNAFCKSKGIIHRFASPYQHERNEKAERMWRTIKEKANTMPIASGMELTFMFMACKYAVFLNNRDSDQAGNPLSLCFCGKIYHRSMNLTHLVVSWKLLFLLNLFLTWKRSEDIRGSLLRSKLNDSLEPGCPPNQGDLSILMALFTSLPDRSGQRLVLFQIEIQVNGLR